jgi:hypothetical protein
VGGRLPIRVAGVVYGARGDAVFGLINDLWLAAAYGPDGSGLLLTDRQEDACSWVTVERAAASARLASNFFKNPAVVRAIEEPTYRHGRKVAA